MRLIIRKFLCGIILSMIFVGTIYANQLYNKTFIDVPFKSVTLAPEGEAGRIDAFYSFKDDEKALVCSVGKTGGFGVWVSWNVDPSHSELQVLRSYEEAVLTSGSVPGQGYVKIINQESFPIDVSCHYVKN